MKIYNKLGIFAAGALLMTSCAVNDPFAENLEIGEVLPTVSWELSSTVCKAGNEAGFLGKYYTTAEGVSIDHSEVWGMIVRTESAAATQKLVTSPAYTLTVASNDTVRGYHLLQTYPHNMATDEGEEFHLNASFPTSKTLGPVTWAAPTEWDVNKFNDYYPATFQAEFCAKMVDYLTADSTYFTSLRNVYLLYDFTAEQIAAVNEKYPNNTPLPFPAEGEVKDDLWFGVDTETIVGYYYTTLEGGVTVEHEVADTTDVPSSIDPAKVFPVYKAPHWVFSRYSDNTGGAVTSVRAEYMPMWKELIEQIPFEAWIYSSADQNYAVEFTRKYSIAVQFKVVDTNNNVGRDTENKSIELN